MGISTQACTRCKRLFEYPGFGYKYCPICREWDRNQFDLVREYVYNNGCSTMMEIVVETGVDQKYIMQYLREGRLEIPENSAFYIKCEGCGCDIRSGRYCIDCATRLSKNLSSIAVMYDVGEKPKSKGGTMHFLDRDSK